MKKFIVTLCTVICALSSLQSEGKGETGPEAGRALAAELCALGPDKDSSMTATLFIQRDRKTEVAVPIEIKLIKDGQGWKSIYQTRGSNAVTLTIHQAPGAQNRYELQGGTNGLAQTTAGQIAVAPFAGSEFWAGDLGLEFFRWNDQHITTNVIRRGQSCHVLESKNTNAAAGAYSKVISWIDQDTLGIVRAEAYDQNGKLLKLFLPTKFGKNKVTGRYEVENVEMRNEQTRLKSKLEFDLKTE
ncbi:MAG: outer membrane lipoprotein-sorting protein [Verrucomicrobiota bacterium]